MLFILQQSFSKHESQRLDVIAVFIHRNIFSMVFKVISWHWRAALRSDDKQIKGLCGNRSLNSLLICWSVNSGCSWTILAAASPISLSTFTLRAPPLAGNISSPCCAASWCRRIIDQAVRALYPKSVWLQLGHNLGSSKWACVSRCLSSCCLSSCEIFLLGMIQ